MLDFPLWKRLLIAAVIMLGLVYAFPNVSSQDYSADLPDFAPGHKLNLGLDLQGGAHLLLQVESGKVIEERLQSLAEEVRGILRTQRLRFANLESSATQVRFSLRKAEDADEILPLLRNLDAGIDVVREGLDFRLSYNEESILESRNTAVEQSLEIIRRRVDAFGTTEPLIQRQGADRIIVQVPGEKNPERLKNTIGKTARLSFHLTDRRFQVGREAPSSVPPGSQVLPFRDGGFAVVERLARVGGDSLTDSGTAFQDNQPVVSFRFDTIGARKFGQVTQDNVGRNLAIILDGEVISAPNIREPILGGSGVISGGFSVAETQDLAILLSAGALPAPITVLEERSVGAGLGQDSVNAGKLAALIALIAVMILVAAYYGLYGIFACFALLLNLMLIVGILSALQATLTLPGIAGIILTVGMAVDANVLIFERIREEHLRGRKAVEAIQEGYKRAIATIADSNLTTLIAAALLFGFGSGPIKGFAVTLSVGIATSLFTAIMVVRFIISLHYRKYKSLPL